MSTMTVGGHTVKVDGRPVATLTYSGAAVTVHRAGGRVAGRLYRSDQPRAHPGTYNAWTAVHPAASTPSDRLLGFDVSLEEGVGMVLRQDEAAG